MHEDESTDWAKVLSERYFETAELSILIGWLSLFDALFGIYNPKGENKDQLINKEILDYIKKPIFEFSKSILTHLSVRLKYISE